MAVLPLNYMGDKVLRKKAKEVKEVDKELETLIGDMIETMYDKQGVGLAANQVGVARRLIVFDNVGLPYGTEPMVLVNPSIIEAEGKCQGEEGCLSIPELVEVVERAERIKVAGLDRQGQPVELEAEGLAARIIQHEIDHLDGVLFVDRVSPLKRNILVSKWNKIRKELVG
ncbi:MAG: peptide deformylase [Candidatus Glassbacteria bacterium]|nr:peptide deformylase [Candidatus Glassbacteria bacterium]